MTGQQLKNSILQMAIQGKLVPQDPRDEPVSELLKKIKAQKECLAKEGKIKNKAFIYSSINEDEIPFEIPATWVWVRFGDISINRDSERIPLSVSEREKLEKIYDYYGASGVIDKVDRYLFDKPLLLIGEDGANLINRSTPIAFIATGQYWVNNHAHVLDYLNETLMEWVRIHINAISLVDYITGTAQPKMNQEKMNSIPIALPPIEEQKRIAAKLESLMPLIESYGKSQEALNALNASLPEKLRQSILQEAIQGRLMPQDPNEEPASVLLERIRAEKARLVKEKKIKADKNESRIFRGDDGSWYEQVGNNSPVCINDSLPFDLPEGWVWCRIKEISESFIGLTYKPSDVSDKGWIVLRSSNIQNGNLVFEDIVKVNVAIPDKLQVHDNDIIICARNGSKKLVGKSALVREVTEPMTFGAFMAICRTPFYNYVSKFLLSPLFFEQLRQDSNTTTIYQLTQNNFNKYLIPLPPLAEQHRIVAKLEEILPKLKSMNGMTDR